MKSDPKIVCLLLGMSLLLAACQSAYPAVPPGKTEIDASVTGDGIVPMSARIEAGKTISLRLKNETSALCTWTLLANPYTAPYDRDDQAAVLFEVPVQPGSSIETSFTAPAAPGEYNVLCQEQEETVPVARLLAVQSEQ